MKGFTYTLPKGIEGKIVSAVEVGPYDESGLAEELNRFFGTGITELTKTLTYLLVHGSDLTGIPELLGGKPFVDPIIHQATLDSPLIGKLEPEIDFDFVLQNMLNPGTSDAKGDTALRQTMMALGQNMQRGDVGFCTQQYFLKGDGMNPEQLAKLSALFSSPDFTDLKRSGMTLEQLGEVSAFLANPDLNRRAIVTRNAYETGHQIQVPVVTLKPETKVEKFDVVSMTDAELLKLNADRRIAANLEELHQFRDMYKDEEFLRKRRELGLDERATDVEIETWFGLRSEHCFHKEFNARITLEDKIDDPILKRAAEKGWLEKDADGNYVLEKGMFKTFVEEPAEAIFEKLEKRGKNWIASMFEDNSGVVLYDEDYMFCIKFETHNSPSNKEPVQGAKTGIDGVNRDIFGTMKGTFDAIANFFSYCTGNPKYKGWLPKGVKHPYVILKGITQGVREGGNESQIPTEGGGVITDPRYIAKCLVYCGTIGWSPVKSADGLSFTKSDPQVGDIVFVAGQPVGIDGVHGATESSLIADANISLGHVQADFSFIQAKMKEMILSAARDSLFSEITDFGAMGLGSASHETARSTGGLELDLALHPTKYDGIQPWQVNCSETQDRMLLVSRPKNQKEILERADLHEVEVTPVGKLTDSGYIHLKNGDQTAALIDIEKLFDKEPRKEMHATWNGGASEAKPEIKKEHTLEESLCLVMEQPDVASKEWFFRQKDSSVKGGTIQGPLIGEKQEVEADATIQKPIDTQGRDHGAIAYAMGIAPKVSDIDPYHAAQKAFIDMAGKIVAVGAALPDMDEAKWDAWAVCGNFCQPNSEGKTTLTPESGEHNLASLIREGIGIREAVEATNIPVISGKDSMKCSCVYDIDLEPFMETHDSDFAREFMSLEDEVREDLEKVREAMGERFDSTLIDEIILSGMPADVRRHIEIADRKRKLKRDVEKGGEIVKEEYEVMGKAIEMHDPDTYLASAAVKIADHRKCVNSAFKEEGDVIYVVGTTRNHLGASQYLSAVGYDEQGAPIEGGQCPKTDLEEFVDVAGALHKAIDNETVASCSYIHNGGLAVALAKGGMAGERGAEIKVQAAAGGNKPMTDEEILYSETPGRFVATVAPQDREKFEELLGGVSYNLIGGVLDKQEIMIRGTAKDESIAIGDKSKVKKSYQKPLSFGMQEMKDVA